MRVKGSAQLCAQDRNPVRALSWEGQGKVHLSPTLLATSRVQTLSKVFRRPRRPCRKIPQNIWAGPFVRGSLSTGRCLQTNKCQTTGLIRPSNTPMFAVKVLRRIASGAATSACPRNICQTCLSCSLFFGKGEGKTNSTPFFFALPDDKLDVTSYSRADDHAQKTNVGCKEGLVLLKRRSTNEVRSLLTSPYALHILPLGGISGRHVPRSSFYYFRFPKGAFKFNSTDSEFGARFLCMFFKRSAHLPARVLHSHRPNIDRPQIWKCRTEEARARWSGVLPSRPRN